MRSTLPRHHQTFLGSRRQPSKRTTDLPSRKLHNLRLLKTSAPVQPAKPLRTFDQVQRKFPRAAVVRLGVVQGPVRWYAQVDDLGDGVGPGSGFWIRSGGEVVCKASASHNSRSPPLPTRSRDFGVVRQHLNLCFLMLSYPGTTPRMALQALLRKRDWYNEVHVHRYRDNSYI